MSKKVETSIHKRNGGNHSPVNYRKHKQMLLSHPYCIGLLYHIVLTGSEDRNVYRKAVELLCKELRKNGMPCRYKACYERDKKKRFHKHVMILIEAKNVHPDTIIHYRKGHWLTEMLHGLGLGFKIAEPDNEIHQVAGKQVNYAYVPKKAGEKLDNCLLWISYLTKVRSKEGVEGSIYTASTNREGKKPDSLPSAPQAERAIVLAQTGENLAATSSNDSYLENTKKGNEMLTPAQTFIASKYEQAVDQQLDLEAIRLFLLSHGIKRTPAQVVYELDEVFRFPEYAASHPAPAMPTLAEFDAAIERSPLRACQAIAAVKVKLRNAANCSALSV